MMNQVILDAKIKLMRRFEIRMACEVHDVVLTHTCFKPVTDGCPLYIEINIGNENTNAGIK